MKFRNYFSKILRFLPALIWMGFIFYLSSVPNLKTELGNFYDILLRKGAHIFEYFVLVVLLWYAFSSIKIWRSAKFNLIFIISFLYAASDELHQSFVPTRSGNFVDLGVDSLGIVAGLVLIFFLKKFK